MSRQPRPPRILVWGGRRIGDVVMTVPALKVLRRHRSRAHLSYVTTFYAREILQLSGLVDEVRPVKLKGGIRNLLRWRRLRKEVRRGDYGEILILGKRTQFERKIGASGQLHCLDDEEENEHVAMRCARVAARAMGVELDSVPDPRLEVEDRPAVTRRLRGLGLEPDRPYVVMHCGCNRIVRKGRLARGSEKLWPPQKYGPFLRGLKEECPGLLPVLVGAQKERPWLESNILRRLPPQLEVLNLVGQTSIRELLQLLRHARLLLSGDSGVMHLGTVVGTPMIVLVGPTDENSTGPFGMGEGARVVREVPLGQAQKDPNSMEKIPVERVLGEVIEHLEGLP